MAKPRCCLLRLNVWGYSPLKKAKGVDMNALTYRIGVLMLVAYGLISLANMMHKGFFMLVSP